MSSSTLAWVPLLLLALSLLFAEQAAALVKPTTASLNTRCCNKYRGACNDLGVYKTNVACTVGTCCPIRATIPRGTSISFDCYVIGEAVGGNTHWLHVTSPAQYAGWVSDNFVNCGGQLCNVPACTVRQVDVSGGITLTTTTTLPQASWMKPMIACFFNSYTKERSRFNARGPTKVQLSFFTTLPNIAQTLGSTISVDLRYLGSNPRDYGLVAHEAMHVAQQYPNTPAAWGYWVEGLADYARYKYGCNFPDVWSLPPPQPGDNYTSSYRVTARFLVWLENRYPAIVTNLDATLRARTYTDAFWSQKTGRTVQQLWASYVASPAI